MEGECSGPVLGEGIHAFDYGDDLDDGTVVDLVNISLFGSRFAGSGASATRPPSLPSTGCPNSFRPSMLTKVINYCLTELSKNQPLIALASKSSSLHLTGILT